MAGRLKPNEPAAKGAARIARRQVKKATEELQSGPDLTDEEVHDVRKRLKKARAALRLLRETIGARRYHRENTATPRRRSAVHPNPRREGIVGHGRKAC